MAEFQNFMIEDTALVGNTQDLESFLSGETVTTDSKDIKLIDDEATGKPKPIVEQPKAAENIDPLQAIEESGEEAQIENEDAPTEGDVNTFEEISKELYKHGILTFDEESEEQIISKTPEELLDLLNKEKQKGASEWLNNFLVSKGEDRLELFKAIFVSGVDPREYIPAHNEAIDLAEMDMSLSDNQEQVLKELYKKQGLTQERISAKLDKLRSYGDLEDEAKDAHELLLKSKKEELVQKEQLAVQKDQLKKQSDDNFKQALITGLEKNKELAGVTLTDSKRKEIFDYVYTPKYKTPDGSLLSEFDKFILESKNPENIDSRLTMAVLAQSGFDFSKIKDKTISQQSKGLFGTLATQKVKATGTVKASTNSFQQI